MAFRRFVLRKRPDPFLEGVGLALDGLVSLANHVGNVAVPSEPEPRAQKIRRHFYGYSRVDGPAADWRAMGRDIRAAMTTVNGRRAD